MPRLPSQIHELTSIRAFAALIVVLFHMFYSADNPAGIFTNLIADGHLGVDLFFMLSGFILTHVYLDSWRAGRFSYTGFLRNRFARLYPLHFVMLLLFLLAYQAAAVLGLESAGEGQNWSHFPWHLILVHAWGFTDGHSWNFPSWSVSAEVFAYLVFPLTLAMVLRIPAIVLGCLAVILFGAASLFALQVLGSPITKLMFNFGILRVFTEFLIGVSIYLLMEKYRLPEAWVRPALILSVLVLLGLSISQADERLIVLALALFLTSIAHLSLETRNNVLRHPWLIYLGEISYATYMVHILALIAVPPIAGKLGIHGVLGLNLMTLAAIYLGSVVLYHGIERPGRRLLRPQN